MELNFSEVVSDVFEELKQFLSDLVQSLMVIKIIPNSELSRNSIFRNKIGVESSIVKGRNRKRNINSETPLSKNTSKI